MDKFLSSDMHIHVILPAKVRGISCSLLSFIKPRICVSSWQSLPHPIATNVIKTPWRTDLVLWLTCSCLPFDSWQRILSLTSCKIISLFSHYCWRLRAWMFNPSVFWWCGVICINFCFVESLLMWKIKLSILNPLMREWKYLIWSIRGRCCGTTQQ